MSTADWPKASPDGLVAATLLAFLATAGLFYVNIMPALVDGLIEGLGFSSRDAGLVGSANVYGAAAGALLIVFIIRRVRWKPTALVLLLLLIGIDLASMLLNSPGPLIGLRFVHGFAGGMLVGIGFSVIARTRDPDRTFGMLLLVQFGLGGLGVMYLPRLVPLVGTEVLFMALIAFSAATLVMLGFLADYPARPKPPVTTAEGRTEVRPLGLVLVAIFLFQAANMGLYAYIIGLGRHYGLTMTFISPVLGIAAWTGIIGSLLVIVFSVRAGRTLPVFAACCLTALGSWALLYSGVPWVFVVANCGVGITWAFVIPYLFGMCSEFDSAGQMAALGGFASKLGLASGPLAAALLLGDDNYVRLIWIAVAALVLSMAAGVTPALLLDRRRRLAVPLAQQPA